jgi:hypothetical protein
MKRFLPNSSIILATTILSASLLTTSVVKANESKRTYSPAAELTTKFSKGRNIAELNYMQPFLANDNHLPILDVKLKLDNKKSKEINLGLVYRYNYNDNAILGAYTYFDHRRTGSGFSINGLTAGVEVLSKYIDARANIYIPQNKRKKIAHNSKKTIEIKGTSIFAISGGHKYESALKGYDIEVGTPLFAFSDTLNEKIGTKVFVARYSFTAKNVKAITGTRFRVEQDLGKVWLGNSSYRFHASAETQFDKVRKRQNFIGVGVKVLFNDKKNSYKKKPTGLSHRMMETVIRDVDIVTESHQETPTQNNFFMDGKEIKKIYYVGSAQSGYSGDGTKDNPLSIEQLNGLNCDDAIIVVTNIDQSKGGKTISRKDYAKIKKMPQVLNGKENTVLTTAGQDKVSIHINGTNGLTISSDDAKNTRVIVEGNQATPTDANTPGQTATIQLLAREEKEQVATQLETARVSHQEATILREELTPVVRELISNNANNTGNQNIENQAVENPIVENQPMENQAVENPIIENIVEDMIDEILPEEENEVVENEEELALQQIGVFKSGVIKDNLTQKQKDLYDLITNCGVWLKTNDGGNAYVIRQKQYDVVAKIITDNPNDDVDRIKGRIQNTIGIVSKDLHKDLAEKIMYFDGVVGGNVNDLGGQQGIGFGHTGPKDITLTSSLEKLRATYGILDGDKAINLAKLMVFETIKENIPLIGNNIGATSIGHNNTPATNEYKAAAKIYLDNCKAVQNETERDKQARIDRKNIAKAKITKGIKSSATAVNKYMAAYRALDRAEKANQYDVVYKRTLFTDNVIGRYNDKEMLAYAIIANIDVREIQKNLKLSGTKLTPTNIFTRQKENLLGLIDSLGDGQRGYNFDREHGVIDVGGINGLYTQDQGGAKLLVDSSTCAHGYCTRIIDSAQHHSMVNLSDASPANFTNEFNNTVKKQVNALPRLGKQGITNWLAGIEEIKVNYGNNGSINFTATDDDENPSNIPGSYQKILTDTATELDSRYSFNNANPKLQLVKKNTATNSFNNTVYIGFD